MSIQIGTLNTSNMSVKKRTAGLGAPAANTSVFIQPTSMVITDLSPNHHTLSSNCTFIQNPDWTGKYVMQSSGSDRWIYGPKLHPSFNLGTGSFTIETIIQPIGNSIGDYGRLIGAQGGYGQTGWALDLPPKDGFPNGVRLESDSNVSVLQSSFTFEKNNLYHIAATRDGTTFRLFVNGLEIGSTTSSVRFNTYDKFQCFYRSPQYPRAIRANFYALRVVKGVSLYNANFNADISSPMYLY